MGDREERAQQKQSVQLSSDFFGKQYNRIECRIQCDSGLHYTVQPQPCKHSTYLEVWILLGNIKQDRHSPVHTLIGCKFFFSAQQTVLEGTLPIPYNYVGINSQFL